MSKKVTVTFSITYDFKGQLLKDYLGWLDDYNDTKNQRKWFVIDRFVGHHNLRLFDQKAKMTVQEHDD